MSRVLVKSSLRIFPEGAGEEAGAAATRAAKTATVRVENLISD